MSGSELRQYLHISTRKLKFLMDNEIIPYIDTRHKTFKYKVKKEDADAFLKHIEEDPKFMGKYKGQFNSRQVGKPRVKYEESLIDNQDFREYITKLWKNIPPAVSFIQAAHMLGKRKDLVSKLMEQGKLYRVYASGTWYTKKDDVIEYALSKEHLLHTFGENFKKVIREYRGRKCCECEHKKRKIKREEARRAKKKDS